MWDAGALGYPDIREQVCEYLAGQGLPVADAYRIEVYVLDAPFARCFTYRENERGQRYLDLDTGDVAVREPFDRPVTELPPPQIRVLL